METYLSFDVGIVNMAYCLLEKQNETDFVIKKWGTIKLSSEPQFCGENNKKGARCVKKALKFATVDDITKYYCGTHCKNFKSKQSEILECDKNDKCMHIINNKNNAKICNKKCLGKIKNDTYCKTHLNQHSKNLDKQNSLQKVAKKNANELSINMLTIKLFTILNTYPEFLNVDYVLIENQQILNGRTMKTIATLLYSYFNLKGIVDNKRIKEVKFINPTNKLKVNKNTTDDLKIMKKTKNNKEMYNKNKELGILFCKELIKHDAINSKILESHTKKDDLCDAFLQGYHYIFCKKGIPTKTQEILDDVLLIDKNKKNNGIDLLDLKFD